MSENSYRPRRRMGCLGRLLVFLLFMGACYWLLLAPISESGTDQTPETTVEAPAEGLSIEGDVNSTQRAALEKMADETGGQVDVLAQNGQIRFLNADARVPSGASVSVYEKAASFFAENSALLQIKNPATSLYPIASSTNEDGVTTLRYEQKYKGIPIYGSSIVLSLGPDDKVISFSASYVPNLELDVQPTIRSIAAEETVLSALGGGDAQILGETSLIIYAPEIWNPEQPAMKPTLCWLVLAGSESSGVSLYTVDARTGGLLDQMSLFVELGGGPDIEIRDARNWTPKQTIYNDWYPRAPEKSKLVMDENGFVSGAQQDPVAAAVQQNAHKVYSYYMNILHRDSYDNKGMLIKFYINTSDCWPGWLKDVPGQNFKNENITVPVNSIFMCPEWAENIDATAHEFTHGVVAYSSNLGDQGEPAALNEAYADIFAAIIDTNDPWKITRDVAGTQIRRRLDDPQEFDRDYPVIYEKKVYPDSKFCSEEKGICCPTINDEPEKGCPHTNSIIWSHAFYRLAVGDNSPQPISEPISLTKLQYIYYETMINLPSGAGFKDAAQNTLAKCNEFSFTQKHGVTPADCEKIRWVFAGTGLVEAMTPVPPGIPSLPPLPDPSAWFDQLRESVWQFFENLLGEWPKKLRQGFNDFIQDIRANYWVKLMECAANNDQACLQQYLFDLLAYIWSAFLEILRQVWINICPNLTLVPLIGVAIYRGMRIK